MMEERILVVFPHPDDESFGTAGTIIQYRQQNVPVTYACGTLGEMGRNMGKPVFANRETLPDIRKQELHEACHIMGLEDLRLLGLRDKTVEFEDPDELAERMKRLIKDVQPTLVITHYPGYAVHPDHDALGAAVVAGASRISKEERPVVRCHAFSENTEADLGEPDVIWDVTDVYDQKINALKAHDSQTKQFASQVHQDHPENDEKLFKWLGYERYWTYDFAD